MIFLSKMFILMVLVEVGISSGTENDSKCVFKECTCEEMYEFLFSVQCTMDIFPTRINSESKQTIKLFELTNSNLKEVPADRLSGLDITILDLEKNQIEKVSENAFRKVGSINALILAHNQIEKIENNTFVPISDHLLELELDYNNLGKSNSRFLSEALQPLENLETLGLNGNYLKVIPDLTGLKNIKEIRLEDNLIKKLLSRVSDKGRLPASLISLNLNNNYLKELNENFFIDLPSLEYLLLESNEIEYISQNAFKYLTSLKTLSLRHNNLNHIPSSAIFFLPNMLLLDLADQKRGISEIEDFAFDRIDDKIYFKLDLSYNNISKISKKAFCTTNLKNRFVNLDQIELTGSNLINLDFCTFKQLFDGFVNVHDPNLKVMVNFNKTEKVNLNCGCEINQMTKLFDLNGVCKEQDGKIQNFKDYKCSNSENFTEICRSIEYDCSVNE